jgi:hypothetical protein
MCRMSPLASVLYGSWCYLMCFYVQHINTPQPVLFICLFAPLKTPSAPTSAAGQDEGLAPTHRYRKERRPSTFVAGVRVTVLFYTHGQYESSLVLADCCSRICTKNHIRGKEPGWPLDCGWLFRPLPDPQNPVAMLETVTGSVAIIGKADSTRFFLFVTNRHACKLTYGCITDVEMTNP